MIEQEEEGCAFGLAANRVDTGWYFGRWSHTGFLAHALQERPGIAFFRPGAEVVGPAFTEGVARHNRRACVKVIGVGGQGFCAFEVDEVSPQVARVRFTVRGFEAVAFLCGHRYEVFDAETE